MVLSPAAIAAGAGLTAGALTWLAAVAGAVAAPDSAALAELQRRLGGHELRVVTALGTTAVPEAVIDGAGIRSPRWEHYRSPRVALIQTPGSPRPPAPPRLIEWSAIDEVQRSRPAWEPGIAAGAVAALGLSVVYGPGLAESGTTRGEWEAMVVAGAAVVGLAVALPFKYWKPVLPQKR